MSSKFLQIIKQDLSESGKSLKELGAWTKVIGFLISLLTLTGVAVFGKDWWLTPKEIHVAPAVWLLIPFVIVLTFWLGTVYLRSRKTTFLLDGSHRVGQDLSSTKAQNRKVGYFTLT
jgi:hypothetical protein